MKKELIVYIVNWFEMYIFLENSYYNTGNWLVV